MICKCSLPYLRFLLDSFAFFTVQKHFSWYNPICKYSLKLFANNTSQTHVFSKLPHSFRSYVCGFPIIVSNPF